MPRKTKINNLTSQEQLDRVDAKNLRLRDDFLDYCKSAQRSPGTIAGYENDLNVFFCWNLEKNDNKFFTKISKRDLVSFQNWLINENGNSPARVRRIKSAISSMSNYIERVLDDEEEFQGFRSIVRKIESPVNMPVREKTVMTEEQLDGLLKELVSKGKYKQACVLALAMYSGRRKSELPRFRVSDFTDGNLVCDGALYKTSNKIKTKGAGLGKYIYCYTLAKPFKPYLDLWMEERAKQGIESEWLFPSASDPTQQLSVESLNGWAITYSNRLGVDFYWHAVRHYWTTAAARSGLPDSAITVLQGWASSAMVGVYKDIDADEELSLYFKGGEIVVPDNPLAK